MLLGDPSDGYHGSHVSLTLQAYWAEVSLAASPTLQLYVPEEEEGFLNLDDLANNVQERGYQGGRSMLLAACKGFHAYCKDKNIQLVDNHGTSFALSFTSNIPRRCGLNSSAAVILGALTCLMRYYGVEDAVPLKDRAPLARACLSDLSQRRRDDPSEPPAPAGPVSQAYGGVVFADLGRQVVKDTGGPVLETLDVRNLPQLYLVLCRDAGGGGQSAYHATLRRRWDSGDLETRAGMQECAMLARTGRDLLVNRVRKLDAAKFAALISQNFALVRTVAGGEEHFGPRSMRAMEIVQASGSAAKFASGAGGALVVLCPKGKGQASALREKLTREGFGLEEIHVTHPVHELHSDGRVRTRPGDHKLDIHDLRNMMDAWRYQDERLMHTKGGRLSGGGSAQNSAAGGAASPSGRRGHRRGNSAGSLRGLLDAVGRAASASAGRNGGSEAGSGHGLNRKSASAGRAGGLLAVATKAAAANAAPRGGSKAPPAAPSAGTRSPATSVRLDAAALGAKGGSAALVSAQLSGRMVAPETPSVIEEDVEDATSASGSSEDSFHSSSGLKRISEERASSADVAADEHGRGR
ncbi:unnamed protein product [Pedinophyceae sp. YPF-701]|nr:unnamed protein product [Pedinophyceae sp. YPF-701]